VPYRLKAIKFVEPKEKMQEDAWGQYVRSKREIRVFSQPQEEVTPKVHMMMKEHVLPHELGHHVALTRRNITDKDLSMAEARADAFAAGLDPEDRDVEFFMRKQEGQRAYPQMKQMKLVDNTAQNIAEFPDTMLGTPVAFTEKFLGGFERLAFGNGDLPVRSVAPNVLPERSGMASMTFGILDKVKRDVDVARGRRQEPDDNLFGPVQDGSSERRVVLSERGRGEMRESFSKKGTQPRRYNYTPTYVAGDLPLIAGDAVGTVGATAVALAPLAVAAGAIYVGGKIIAKEVKKSKKGKK